MRLTLGRPPLIFLLASARGTTEGGESKSCESANAIDWKTHAPFHPVVDFRGEPFDVLDFSAGPPDWENLQSWWVGKYNEVRPNTYDSALFGNTTNSIEGFAGLRDVHVGLDLGGPAGTPVYAPMDGVVTSFGYNPAAKDYGHVVVLEHTLDGLSFWALYGHLSAASIEGKEAGMVIPRGEIFAWLGAFHENGNWPPHVHLQLSLTRPETHDLPGAVSRQDRSDALRVYPDPRLVVGDLF